MTSPEPAAATNLPVRERSADPALLLEKGSRELISVLGGP
jgi:hypothetical protein